MFNNGIIDDMTLARFTEDTTEKKKKKSIWDSPFFEDIDGEWYYAEDTEEQEDFWQ